MQILKKLIPLTSLLGILVFPLFAQYGLEAIVKNPAGEVVPGASISIIGTSIFTVAADDGSFQIEEQQKLPFDIRVSSIGYRPKTLTVSSLADFPSLIVLESDHFLSEIVVTSRR